MLPFSFFCSRKEARTEAAEGVRGRGTSWCGSLWREGRRDGGRNVGVSDCVNRSGRDESSETRRKVSLTILPSLPPYLPLF